MLLMMSESPEETKRMNKVSEKVTLYIALIQKMWTSYHFKTSQQTMLNVNVAAKTYELNALALQQNAPISLILVNHQS